MRLAWAGHWLLSSPVGADSLVALVGDLWLDGTRPGAEVLSSTSGAHGRANQARSEILG